MLKCHHHLLGKADIITLIRNVFPVEPGGHGKLIVVYSQSVVAIQITVEAKQKGSGEGPWLENPRSSTRPRWQRWSVT